jgi:DNA-binding NtrC family response regulator
MREVLDAFARAARSEALIIMRVEAAPTTELARWVNDNRPWRDGTFVRLSYPSMKRWPPDVFRVDEGTLFVEEVGDVAADYQAELLRALDGLGPRAAGLRIVSSSRRDLDEAVERGALRRDLYFRLNVVDIGVPTLRGRRKDVIPLALRLVEDLGGDLARRVPRLPEAAASSLASLFWPGNERELANVVQRALLATPGDRIDAQVPKQIGSGDIDGRPRLGGDFTLGEIEHEHIARVTARVPAPERAARILGISKTTLARRRAGTAARRR